MDDLEKARKRVRGVRTERAQKLLRVETVGEIENIEGKGDAASFAYLPRLADRKIQPSDRASSKAVALEHTTGARRPFSQLEIAVEVVIDARVDGPTGPHSSDARQPEAQRSVPYAADDERMRDVHGAPAPFAVSVGRVQWE